MSASDPLSHSGYNPLLDQWGARALYIGQAAGLSAHRNGVAVLAVGLDRPFLVAKSPAAPEVGAWSARTALIMPNTLHALECGEGVMGFLYVDALSSDLIRLQAGVREWQRGVGLDLTIAQRLIEILRALALRRTAVRDAKAKLQTEFLGERRPISPQVAAAIDYLNAHAGERPDIEHLANMAELSASRFRRVFKATTGVPLRRYRIWAAMGAALRLARTHTLTEAALAAGFSSSAHFSVAFRDMFGMEPSRLMRQGLFDLRAK